MIRSTLFAFSTSGLNVSLPPVTRPSTGSDCDAVVRNGFCDSVTAVFQPASTVGSSAYSMVVAGGPAPNTLVAVAFSVTVRPAWSVIVIPDADEPAVVVVVAAGGAVAVAVQPASSANAVHATATFPMVFMWCFLSLRPGAGRARD